MVNKEKTLKRELIRLRKTQNPQQLDFRRMRQISTAKAKLRRLKRRPVAIAPEAPKKRKKAKPEKAKKKKKEEEPELELIDDEAELEFMDELEAIEKELIAEREAAKEKAKTEKKRKKKEKEPEIEVIEEEEAKPKKKKKEPELEVIEEEPELEETGEDLELEDLYSYDEDIDEEDVE